MRVRFICKYNKDEINVEWAKKHRFVLIGIDKNLENRKKLFVLIGY